MNLNLITVEEAKKIVEEQSFVLQPTVVALKDAVGMVLSVDIVAPVSIPAFAQSGMDGYAIAFKSIGNPIQLVGEQAAGSNQQQKIVEGTAVRIFTGAVVPEGANTVVMQEKMKIENGYLQIEDANLKQGDNVRLAGSEVAKGSLALVKGAVLTPAAIGFLAAMGIANVEIIPNPRVSIIVTGNELQNPGTVAEYGKVFESNSFSLIAALKQLHISDVTIYQSIDDIENLTKTLNEALLKADIVLMTGGVSVGDYDFTVQVSEKCGIQKIFHKIKQRPGKPIFFGKKENILFFGLPGNPASVLTCFYEYVLIALEIMTKQKVKLKVLHATISTNYKKPNGITHFLKGIYDGEKVHLPDGQESYKLNSFAKANCLVKIPDTIMEVTTGEKVEIHLLP
jgi:molybdopterin molybdotransferase